MELETTELRLQGRTPWRNTCPHPPDDRLWRYLPVFDYGTSQLLCGRCGDVLNAEGPAF